MKDGNRRQFLAGLSALGASTFLHGCAATGDTATSAQRIDVHHHFVSPGYSAAL